jgi:hypothetical protein
MAESDDLSEKDPEFDQFAEEYEAHRDALLDVISNYLDDHELEEAYVAQLLFDLNLNMRMTAYGMGVENPSVAGLRLDLDRWQRDVVEAIRHAKKGAEEYIRTVKEVTAAADAEEETKPE